MTLTPRTLAAAAALLAVLNGCKDEPDPPPPPSGPELSETPLWQVKADPSLANECFGSSVALADFNGDGRKDLAVGSVPCETGFVPAQHPGRVSFFAGEERFFSTQAASGLMTWQNTHPRTSGQNLRVIAGNVNGDAYADLLVHGRYGGAVFLGGPDLGAIMAQPAFRVPGNGLFFSHVLVDLNGDGLDDLVSIGTGSQSFFLSTPGAEGGPFTLAQRRPVFTSAQAVGDLNGDGAGDLLMPREDAPGMGVFLGCKPGSTFACNGPLSAEPLWTVDFTSMRLHPDLNGDGHKDAFVWPDNGLMQIHFSEADGRISPVPVWSMLPDPTFFNPTAPVEVGDMDGDGERHDFVVSALGRVYFFSPAGGVSGALRPVWAWPRSDSHPNTNAVSRRYSVAVPGDLDGDGFDDLVVANTSAGDSPGVSIGDVAIYGGGRVPKQPEEPPYVMPFESCGLSVDPVNGKPDLTVDRQMLERTVHVMRRSFTADSCEVQEACVGGPGERRLLRFSTSIQNLGNADLVMPSLESRPDIYVFDACHGHDHVKGFAGYDLLDGQGQRVLSGRKQGYALVDITPYCTDAGPYTYHDPMGISAGWADIYTYDIPCQWVDITGQEDGEYTLRVGVDESDIVEEGTRYANEVFIRVKLEGDTATALP